VKRPAFKPTDIGVGAPDPDGAVVLHLRDAKGNEQEVPLTAALRAALGQRLLSGPLAEVSIGGPALYVAPANTRVYQRGDGDHVLELQTGGGRAVHVLLPGLLAEGLSLQLRQMLDAAPSASKH
jgi:hypothetical protein